MSRSPAHKHYSLADIEWKVMPAVLSGQFYIAEAEHKEHGVRAPVAVVTWARVSEDVDQRLIHGAGSPVRLRPTEWTSGDIYWLIDMIGDVGMIALTLKELKLGPFIERNVKLEVREGDGSAVIATLQSLFERANLDGAMA